MIHRTEPLWQTPDWQISLANGFTCVNEFFEYLRLDPELLPAARLAAAQFSLRVPRDFAALIEKGNPDDPILRQVLPLDAEMDKHAGFQRDPVGDLTTETTPGVLQKYHGRHLLIASGACGINCRYCFRRHYPYGESSAGRDGWRSALASLRADKEAEEVILSGGDPLTLSDQRLTSVTQELNKIPHLKRLRIHSRLPLIVPERVTPEMLNWLTAGPLKPVLVLHINHPAEISTKAKEAFLSLRQAGVTLLNQSVLLRGVNDSVETLATLSGELFECGVLPYYLHLLDRVEGAAHFDMAEERAREIHRLLRKRQPGYLVPKLVRETPGERSKTPVW